MSLPSKDVIVLIVGDFAMNMVEKLKSVGKLCRSQPSSTNPIANRDHIGRTRAHISGLFIRLQIIERDYILIIEYNLWFVYKSMIIVKFITT